MCVCVYQCILLDMNDLVPLVSLSMSRQQSGTGLGTLHGQVRAGILTHPFPITSSLPWASHLLVACWEGWQQRLLSRHGGCSFSRADAASATNIHLALLHVALCTPAGPVPVALQLLYCIYNTTGVPGWLAVAGIHSCTHQLYGITHTCIPQRANARRRHGTGHAASTCRHVQAQAEGPQGTGLV